MGTCGFGDTWLPWGHMAWCKKQQECDHGVSPCGEPGTHGDSHVCAVQLRGRRPGRSCFYFALLVLSPPLPRERGQRWGQGGQGAALSCGEGTETCGTMGAEPCRAELCRAGCQPLFPSSSPVRGPAVRQRCPRGGGGGGGDRGTLVLCHCGAPPAPSLNVALVPHRPRVSPVTFAPGPGCPQQEEGDKPGHTSAARGPWEPWLCPQLPESGPQTPSPPPRRGWPCQWPRPQEHERGTRSRFPVILGRINQAGDRCGGE